METAAQPVALTPALIVEDDAPTRRRLRALLEGLTGTDAHIVETADLAGAERLLRQDDFTFALIDIGLPDGNGVELIGWLHEHRPHVTSVVVSVWGDEATVLAALRAGATGYLLKDRDDAELTAALGNVQRGGAPIDPFVARGILALLPGAGDAAGVHAGVGLDDLTERESEILNLVAHGHNNRRIAELTGLSRFTIEDYTKRIYRKLAVGSRAAAVFEAQARGLLK